MVNDYLKFILISIKFILKLSKLIFYLLYYTFYYRNISSFLIGFLFGFATAYSSNSAIKLLIKTPINILINIFHIINIFYNIQNLIFEYILLVISLLYTFRDFIDHQRTLYYQQIAAQLRQNNYNDILRY